MKTSGPHFNLHVNCSNIEFRMGRSQLPKLQFHSSIYRVSKIIKRSRANEPDIILRNEGQGVQPLELVPQINQLHVHEQVYEDRLETDRLPRLFLKGIRADDGEVTRGRRRQDVLLQAELAPPPEGVQVQGGRPDGEEAAALDGDDARDLPGVRVERPEGVVACAVGATVGQEPANVQEASEQPGLDGIWGLLLSEKLRFRTHLVVVRTETLPSEAIIRADLWRIRDVCKEICRGEIIKSDRVGGARSGIEV